MPIIGSNTFEGCYVPLIYEDFVIIQSQDSPPKTSIARITGGPLIFEILNDEPQENPYTNVETNVTGIITVSDKESGKFLYKLRPDSDTSIVFGKIGEGGEEIIIKDDKIIIFGAQYSKNKIRSAVGIWVKDNSIAIGSTLPPYLSRLFESK